MLLNVTEDPFGAAGDGIADDTAAIQAAIDAADDANGAVVYLPSGVYRTTAPLLLRHAVTLRGDGRTASIISADGLEDSIIRAPAPAFSLNTEDRIFRIVVEDLGVENDTSETSMGGGAGIDFRQVSLGFINRCRATRCEIGMQLYNLSLYNVMELCESQSCGTAFRVGNTANQNTLILCRCTTVTDGFVFEEGADGGANAVTLINCAAETYTGIGYHFNASSPHFIDDVMMLNCRAEGGATGIRIEAACNNVEHHGTRLVSLAAGVDDQRTLSSQNDGHSSRDGKLVNLKIAEDDGAQLPYARLYYRDAQQALFVRNQPDTDYRDLWARAIRLNGGDLQVVEGAVTVLDSESRNVFQVDAETARVRVGTNGNEGDIGVQDGQGRSVFRVDGRTAHLRVGTEGNEGDIAVQDGQGRTVFRVDGNTAHLRVGAEGNEGDIAVQDGQGRAVFRMDGQSASLRLGASGNEGDLRVLDGNGNVAIHLDGQTGTCECSGEDCAENFDVAPAGEIAPGTVMVLEPDGRVVRSILPYDTKVAGVVSGGGDLRPGILLSGDRTNTRNRVPLALAGKVFCRVDARHGPIEAGDLLTTSPTPGHAMRAGDPARAVGAIIGKALRPMRNGSGLIPILVALG
jgi:hypothetical protein